MAEHGCEVYNLNILDEECVSPKGMYSDKIHLYGIKKKKLEQLYAFPFIGRFLRFLYFRIKYISILLRIRPDIIVSTQPTLEPLSVVVLTFWIKRILELHGWYNVHAKKDLLWRDKWYGMTKYRIYHIVCLTQREATHLKGLFGCKAGVIPNGNNVKTTQYADCTAKCVLALARFAPEKNFASFLPAWRKVQERHPDWTLELYGEGEEEPEMRRIVKSNELSTVHMHPYTSDVATAYLNASIYILPSLSEGFPLVLAESMSYGVPAVAYDCPCGPSEIIRNGIDGFLTAYNNPVDMADKINYLIEHEDLRKRMGERARQNIRRFDLDEIMCLWMKMFYQLVDKK